VGAIPRLLDIGILPDIMAGNIIGIIAQRLIRRLCGFCKEAFEADEVERRLLGLTEVDPAVTIHRAIGCDRCAHQGYKGRISIVEMLKLNSELDDLIARRATTSELKRKAMAMGFRPLVEDAVRRVLDGSTSLDEISRVVDLTDRLM
jgi:general secretion pathway protein E/type IV pilus assembly protein PilB